MMQLETSHRFWKWAIAVGVSILVLNHVLMTLTYLSPPNLLKKDLGALAYWYMSPLFYQNWHLFSPRPGISSTKLAVRCREPERGWSIWFDPLENLYSQHYRYRVLGYGKLMYVYREIAIDLKQEFQRKQTECLQSLAQSSDSQPNQCGNDLIAEQVANAPEYALTKRFAVRVCENLTREVPFDQIQFKVLEFYPLKYSERNQTDKRWSQVEETIFPPVTLTSPR